jgi:hypothetical protein
MLLIVALEFCAVFFLILRRMMPVETSCAMLAVRNRFFILAWLGLYFVARLAPLDFQLVSLILLAFGFSFGLTLVRRFDRVDDELLIHRFLLVRPIASRAPPSI